MVSQIIIVFLHSVFELRGDMVLTVGNVLASTKSMVSCFPSHMEQSRDLLNNDSLDDPFNYFLLCSVHADRGNLCSGGDRFNCIILPLCRPSLHDAGLNIIVSINPQPSSLHNFLTWIFKNVFSVQVNNKKICISYKKNILFALITAIIAGRSYSHNNLLLAKFPFIIRKVSFDKESFP